MAELLEKHLDDMRKVGVSQAICDGIAHHIEMAPQPQLYRISPFRMADAWSLDRNDVLNAFLYGTKAGIFDLEWDIKCPSCKGPTTVSATLAELISKAHCNYCQIDIDGGFDNAVEVTFRVNPNIRNIGNVPFLDVMQAWIHIEEPFTISADPGGQQEVHITLTPGSYHMYQPGFGVSRPLVVTEKQVETPRVVEYTYDGENLVRGKEWLGTGPFVLRLLNQSDERAEFEFSRAKDFPWVSGAMVASNQIFRDYFSAELISSDESFAVQHIVFVFTDIKGSTELYERQGDSKAYYLVKEHFKILKETVTRNNGAIVKTIGDAIMASFLVSSDATSAVFEMHNAFHEFNTEHLDLDDIVIKVGMHRGPCIAVTSNDRLDYFGRVVNIAARVQGLSGGKDIMMSKQFYEEPGIQEQVQDHGWKVKPMQATLKGVQGLYDVMHITKGETS